MVLSKTCPSCGITYTVNTQRLKHGRQISCSRACSYKIRGEKLTKPESEKFDIKSYNKAYYLKHSEKIKKHVNEYKRITGYKYVLSEAQKEASRERARKWYANNKQLMIDRAKMWKKENTDKVNAGSRSYASRRRGAVGSYSVNDFIRLKNIYMGLCAYCKKNKSDSIDHVVPLSKGGSNYIGNILPVCKRCNSSKGSKTLYEWRQYSGRLLSV